MKTAATFFVGSCLLYGCLDMEGGYSEGSDQTSPESSETIEHKEDHQFENILLIEVEEDEKIVVNHEIVQLVDLKNKISDFYLTNREEQKDSSYPSYYDLKRDLSVRKLHQMEQDKSDYDTEYSEAKRERAAMEKNVRIFEITGMETIRLINTVALIQLKIAKEVSSDFEEKIQTCITESISSLRQMVCDELGWGDYLVIEKDSDSMMVLETFIPERVIETIK